jgi:hypothetical protein
MFRTDDRPRGIGRRAALLRLAAAVGAVLAGRVVWTGRRAPRGWLLRGDDS